MNLKMRQMNVNQSRSTNSHKIFYATSQEKCAKPCLHILTDITHIYMQYRMHLTYS